MANKFEVGDFVWYVFSSTLLLVFVYYCWKLRILFRLLCNSFLTISKTIILEPIRLSYIQFVKPETGQAG